MTEEARSIILFAVVTTFLILLLVGFIFAIIVLYKRKQNLYYQTLENVKLENDKKLLETQVKIQEETFQEISREIHDSVNQVLSLARFKLLSIQSTDEKISASVENCIGMIEEAMKDLTNISRSLSSDLIHKNGLIKTLEFEIERIQSAAINFTLDLIGQEVRLEGTRELIIFRVIQEAINNTLRHARARDIYVTLQYKDDQLIVIYRDDGEGFDVQKTISGSAQNSGLMNMQQRANLIGGECRITSSSRTGTQIMLTIPIKITSK